MDGTSNLSAASLQLDVPAGLVAAGGACVGDFVGAVDGDVVGIFVGSFDGCFVGAEVTGLVSQIPHVPGQLIFTSSIVQR